MFAPLGMDDFRFHGCGHCTWGEGREYREVCSFCAAKAVSPEKRSGAMKAVFKGEQLQQEILELLNPSGANKHYDLEVRSSCACPDKPKTINPYSSDLLFSPPTVHAIQS